MVKSFLIALSCLVSLSGGAARATTPDDVVTATLLQGWQTKGGSVMMALRLTLTPGWKTYWRSPGDAGIPPSFNWTGSENLGGVTVHWPRPSVFEINGMTSIGYHDELVLPIEVQPQVAGQPIEIALQMDLGVCKDICVPASLSVTGAVDATAADSAAIKAALGTRPVSGRSAGLGRIRCDITPIADGMRVAASLDLPPLGRDETVIFEAGTAGVWVSEAETRRDGATLRSWVDMVGESGAPFALDRSGITLTILAKDAAVEVKGCPAGD